MSIRGLDRRVFHLSVIYGLWAAITGALTVPAFIYLLFPPRAKKKVDWVDVGDVTKMRVNEPEEVVFRRRRIDGWKVTSEKSTAWVVRPSEREVVAFAPLCTHLGCAYHWDEPNKEFLCPCHTSTFALDGRVLTGPAPRPLDQYEIKVEGSKLWIGDVRKSQSV